MLHYSRLFAIMLIMSRPICQKCVDCAKNYNPRIIRETHIHYKPKPECWSDTACPKKRSYYRNIEYYRELQRKNHRYIKFIKDHCLICGFKQQLEAHHIIPQYLNGKDTQENIVTLCKHCHKIITSYHKRIGYIS